MENTEVVETKVLTPQEVRQNKFYRVSKILKIIGGIFTILTVLMLAVTLVVQLTTQDSLVSEMGEYSGEGDSEGLGATIHGMFLLFFMAFRFFTWIFYAIPFMATVICSIVAVVLGITSLVFTVISKRKTVVLPIMYIVVGMGVDIGLGIMFGFLISLGA